MTPEERVVVLSSLAEHSADEAGDALRAAAEVTDWRAVYALASGNATAPLVWYTLERLGATSRVPEDVARDFSRTCADVRAANDARLRVARRMFARFAEAKIPVVILKGVLFAETIYKNSFYKKMNDVDILIRKEDLDRVYDLYEELGFFSAAELVSGNPRKQEKFSHHAPPFFSRDLACMIGTHWGLITPLAPYDIDYDAIWSRVRDVDFLGIPAKSMAPEDNLHHLAVHLPYYKCGVRELADIYNLVRAQRIDWNLFLGEVKKAGTENLVYHALSLANRLVPREDVGRVIEAVRPRTTYYFRRDTKRKIESVSRLLRGRSVQMSRIEKAYADLNATHDAREKRSAYARMWRHLLVPPTEDVLKLNALESASGLELAVARAMAPVRIYRVFARDLGGKMFFAILAKSAYDCARAVVAPKEGAQDLGAFAARIGVTVAELERLKEALE